MRRLAALAALGVSLAALPAAAQHTLHELEVNGPSDNRIDFLLMGDGYAAAEQDAFLADVDQVIEGLFSTTPYGEYRPFFNLYAIATVSAESGADHPAESLFVDTAFGCYYDCFDIDRAICCDDATVFAVADALLPTHDAMLLLVNETEYGGTGGAYAIISMNEWVVETAMHEFSHSFAGLADEYEDPYPEFPFSDVYPNVSVTADRDALKWAEFVDEATPLPTPEPDPVVDPLGPVGAYEGACYQSTGLYRPVPECLMRTLANGPCPVCSQALVLSYYGRVEPIDSSAPAAAAVAGAAGDTIEFSVTAVEPDPSTTAIRWRIDGVEIVGADAALSVPIECLEPGAHEVEAEVHDETALVLGVYDPESLLTGARTWTVTRTDDGAVAEDCFDETDTDSETGGDADADADVDADADADSDADADGGGGSGDDGCGCRAAGGATPPGGLLRAFI